MIASALLDFVRETFNDRRSVQLVGYFLLLSEVAPSPVHGVPYPDAVSYLQRFGFSRTTAYDAAWDLRKAGLICQSS